MFETRTKIETCSPTLARYGVATMFSNCGSKAIQRKFGVTGSTSVPNPERTLPDWSLPLKILFVTVDLGILFGLLYYFVFA